MVERIFARKPWGEHTSMWNSAIDLIVTLGTLGLIVAATIALGASKVTDPSESTCVAYMEADQRDPATGSKG